VLKAKVMFASSLLPLFCKVFKLYLFTHADVHRNFHIMWCSCRLIVTWHVPLMEQELL